MQSIRIFKKTGIILFWLLLWQMLAILVNNRILIVGPLETFRALWRLLPRPAFWQAAGGTAFFVVSGFLLGGLAGMACAGLAYCSRFFRELVAPLLSVFRAVPIVSFVILLLIWQGSRRLSFFISLMVVFVVMYGNTLNGLLGMKAELVQAAKLLRVGWYQRVRYIYLPEIYPEIKSGLELSIGMAFKSGIAAEVVGQPARTIGNALYQSKIFLETDGVLAYTLTAVCAAWLAEKVFVFLWSVFFGARGLEALEEKQKQY